MLLWLLTACVPQTLDIGSAGTEPDTASADSGADTNDPPVPELDYDRWSGVRVLSQNGCDGELIEVGERLDEDWVQYDLLRGFCDDCEHWYVLDVSPETVCGLPVSTYTFRGLRLGAAVPELYWMAEGAAEGGHLADASWLGETLTYSAEFFGVEHVGTVGFPEAAPD
jgi:hypothetical protein